MKRVTGLFIVLSGATITVSAQKLQSSEIPAAVKNTFEKQHPGSKDVKWEKENKDYEAGFMNNKTETTVVYDTRGVFKESEAKINANELPANATSYISTNYKGAIIKETAKITKVSGEVNYEAEVKGMDLIFDAAGKFIKSVRTKG